MLVEGETTNLIFMIYIIICHRTIENRLKQKSKHRKESINEQDREQKENIKGILISNRYKLVRLMCLFGMVHKIKSIFLQIIRFSQRHQKFLFFANVAFMQCIFTFVIHSHLHYLWPYFYYTLYSYMLFVQSQYYQYLELAQYQKHITMIHCPYVRKHKVEPRNFADHLQKCKKSLPSKILSKFATCRYNSLHIFPIFDIDAHELNCPNKKQMTWLEQMMKQQSCGVLVEEMSRVSESSVHEIANQKINEVNKTSKGGFVEKFSICSGDDNQSNLEDDQVIKKKMQKNKKKIKLTGINITSQNIETKGKQFPPISIHQGCIQTLNQPNQLQKIEFPEQPKVKKQIKNDHSLKLQLHQCKQCNQILCDSRAQLWKNKKLAKYLKAYQKLEEEHQQILHYLSSISRLIQRAFSESSGSQGLDCENSQNLSKIVIHRRSQVMKMQHKIKEQMQIKYQKMRHCIDGSSMQHPKANQKQTKIRIQNPAIVRQNKLRLYQNKVSEQNPQKCLKMSQNTKQRTEVVKNMITLHD